MEIKVGSLFAGIGGFDICFADRCKIWANEIDKNACYTYSYILKDSQIVCDDISNILNNIPDIDILTAGFPCQSFSLAGERKGFRDDRGQLFYRIMDVVDIKRPRILFLENVKNIINHDNGNTFKIIKEEIENRNYNIVFCNILNTMEYSNLPQNRERLFLIASFDKIVIKMPEKVDNFINVIDINIKKSEKYYYKLGNKYFCNKKYIDFLDQIDEIGSFYQIRRGMYVRKNTKSVCPTLTANMGSGGHNVPIIRDGFGIRKLTPQECFKLQGFDVDISEIKISDCHLYKQIGNSVTIPLVRQFADQIVNYF